MYYGTVRLSKNDLLGILSMIDSGDYLHISGEVVIVESEFGYMIEWSPACSETINYVLAKPFKIHNER